MTEKEVTESVRQFRQLSPRNGSWRTVACADPHVAPVLSHILRGLLGHGDTA